MTNNVFQFPKPRIEPAETPRPTVSGVLDAARDMEFDDVFIMGGHKGDGHGFIIATVSGNAELLALLEAAKYHVTQAIIDGDDE